MAYEERNETGEIVEAENVSQLSETKLEQPDRRDEIERHCRNCKKLQERRCPVDADFNAFHKALGMSGHFEMTTVGSKKFSRMMRQIMGDMGECCTVFEEGENWRKEDFYFARGKMECTKCGKVVGFEDIVRDENDKPVCFDCVKGTVEV